MKTITLGAITIQVFPSGACLVEDRSYKTLDEMAEAEGLSIKAVRNVLACAG